MHSQQAFAGLQGQVAVVTGSSSGIGRAIALEFARAGADVVVHFAHAEDAAADVVREIAEWGGRAFSLQCDLSNCDHETFIGSISKGIASEFARERQTPDIWVNNAGVDLLTGPNKHLTYAKKLEKLWQIDVCGTALLSREIAHQMRTSGGGVILNIGWDQADRGMEGDSGELFATAKNAIMGLTRSLAVSYAPEVRVNCIAPGWIQTAWGDVAPPVWQERVMRETPLKRWGQPQDIAHLARFLVSREASYITGQVINANGGAIR